MNNIIKTSSIIDFTKESLLVVEQEFTNEFMGMILQRAVTKNLKLLDIGSGKGNHLVGFSRNKIDCYGIDKRDEAVNINKNFIIKECDLEKQKFPYDDNFFDIVFSKSVIEHVENADNFLSETYRVLKKNGIIIFLTPDWGTHYKTFWDDYTHVKAWTRKALQNALLIHNFKNVECKLFRQLPILWKFPFLETLADITAILPEKFKWKDKEEKEFREWIRFSKEKMLLAVGQKT